MTVVRDADLAVPTERAKITGPPTDATLGSELAVASIPVFWRGAPPSDPPMETVSPTPENRPSDGDG